MNGDAVFLTGETVNCGLGLPKIFSLRGCQTIDKVGRFCLPIKSANESLSSGMQKSTDFVSR